jgi:hypothetical protein
MTIYRAVAPSVCIAVLTFEVAAHEAILPDQHTHQEGFAGDSFASSLVGFSPSGTASMAEPHFDIRLDPPAGTLRVRRATRKTKLRFELYFADKNS